MSSSNGGARAAVVVGALAALAIPAGVIASRYISGVSLLRSLYVTVPASCVLGIVGVVSARRARLAAARSVRGATGGLLRLGRLVAWTGLYLGVTGALALAVYGALRWAQ